MCRDANSNNRDLKNASSTSCVFSGTLLVATSLNSTTVRRNSEGRCSDHTTLAVTVHVASPGLSKQAEKQQCLKTQICSFSDHLTFSSNVCSFKLGLLQKKRTRKDFETKKTQALNVPFKGIYPEGWNKILQHIFKIFIYSSFLLFMVESVSAQFVHISA